MFTTANYVEEFTQAKVNADLNFVRALVTQPNGGRGQSMSQLGTLIVGCGYVHPVEWEQAAQLIGTITSGKDYGDFFTSPYAHFIMLLSSVRDWATLRAFVSRVCLLSTVHSASQMTDITRECLMQWQTRRNRNGFIRQSVYGVPAGFPVPPLDHGFRPGTSDDLANNNAVFIYHPAEEPLIFTVAQQTHYSINGFVVLFSMDNFDFSEAVEVELHSSVQDVLPRLRDVNMTAEAFRRYFDTTKRADNIKALMNIIN